MCKLILGDGLGHNMYKRIEKEREAWVKRLREAETLREYLTSQLLHAFGRADSSRVHPGSARRGAAAALRDRLDH